MFHGLNQLVNEPTKEAVRSLKLTYQYPVRLKQLLEAHIFRPISMR